jgi:pimeloyl-ACP methyl ester carboxylesterase
MDYDLGTWKREAEKPRPSKSRTPAVRHDVEFKSDGLTCRAWLYEPDDGHARPAPCIVMAHGLGGTRECGLDPYARRFAEAGFFVLLFDYRFIGASEGEPRQVIEVGRQLDDWTQAITYARTHPGIDSRRIGLWGTSLSGGHVLVLAAQDPHIAAISAQCPMVDGHASIRMIVRDLGWGHVIRLGLAALRDTGRAALRKRPYYVPIVTPPGGLAAMASHDAFEGLGAITPQTWRNDIAARMFLKLRFYRPKRAAKSVKCPALVIACDKDSVTSTEATRAAARSMGDGARLVTLPIGHFDIYLGEWFERSSAAQLEFFQESLMAQHA